MRGWGRAVDWANVYSPLQCPNLKAGNWLIQVPVPLVFGKVAELKGAFRQRDRHLTEPVPSALNLYPM